MRSGGPGRWLACVVLSAVAGGGAASSVFEPPPDSPSTAAQPAPELEAVLILTDGRRISGFLVEQDAEKVVLRIHGIATPFGREIVERVETLAPVSDRYRAMRAAIKDDDTAQLILLCKWLFAYERYDDALRELEALDQREPGNPEVLQLLGIARQQVELRARSTPGEPAPEPAPAPRPRRERDEPPTLTPEQINLIRVYEVNLNDPPRLDIPREAVEQMIETYAGDPLIPPTREGREALFRLPPARILELFFRLRARELYPQVRVLEHPKAIKLFRDSVHSTWLINACASSQCHGGAAAGRLRLINTKPNTDATVYTNLLILDRYRTTNGQPLIDYDKPAESVLLQMALPPRIASVEHPPVAPRGPRFRPVFQSRDDAAFRSAVRWIQAMYRPRQGYPIEYTPAAPFEPPKPEERLPR